MLIIMNQSHTTSIERYVLFYVSFYCFVFCFVSQVFFDFFLFAFIIDAMDYDECCEDVKELLSDVISDKSDRIGTW